MSSFGANQVPGLIDAIEAMDLARQGHVGAAKERLTPPAQKRHEKALKPGDTLLDVLYRTFPGARKHKAAGNKNKALV